MPTARTKEWSATQKRLLLNKLAELYPEPESELNFKNEFELVVCVLLSAQCTDKKVNQVTPELFSQYPDFTKLSRASLSSLEKIIRPINYYKTKSRHLKHLAQRVLTEYDGNLPLTHEQLITLPGVGRKTANVVLSELGVAPALAVDTHVTRLSHRLGLSQGKTPLQIEHDLCRQFAPKRWRELHHYLILHGRRVCKAGRPLCSTCSLVRICPSSRP